MEIFAIILIGIIVFLVGKSIYDKKTRIQKLHNKLKREWGDVPRQEYSALKLDSLKKYYEQFKNEKTDIDDITWNDINMEQIYMTINNTCSALGEEYLYALLKKPIYDEEVLNERNRLIEFFQNNPEKRIKIQEIFTQMGKLKDLSVYEYMSRLSSVPKEDNSMHYMMLCVISAAIATIFIEPAIGVFALIAAGIINIIKYYKRKLEIEKYFTIVSYIIRMLYTIDDFNHLNYSEVNTYKEAAVKASRIFKSFKKGSRIVASKKASGDLGDVFIDYFRMLFHFDLIKFNNMIKTFENNKNCIDSLFESIGFLDAMIAVASFRELMVEYCVPVLEKSKKPFIHTDNIYHPMIDAPVKSSIHENNCVLITGSNASGKSTFIKTLEINAILAQTIFTVTADSYKGSYFKIASSMALADNLLNNESYYIVEIKSLKRIIDRIEGDIPVLCFIDEVLRGTNTVERISASSQILYSFASKNAMCFAATHDIELTYILEKYFSNYHFQEEVIDKEILFDYKLYKGRTLSRNAIKLLNIIGYPDEIIKRATDRAEHFLEKGEWESIK